jgi:hypothetical protein
MPSSASPPHLTASTENHCALRHYERAIAALHSEPYRGMPPDLRTDLLRRLCDQRDALLRHIAHANPRPDFTLPSARVEPGTVANAALTKNR